MPDVIFVLLSAQAVEIERLQRLVSWLQEAE